VLLARQPRATLKLVHGVSSALPAQGQQQTLRRHPPPRADRAVEHLASDREAYRIARRTNQEGSGNLPHHSAASLPLPLRPAILRNVGALGAAVALEKPTGAAVSQSSELTKPMVQSRWWKR